MSEKNIKTIKFEEKNTTKLHLRGLLLYQRGSERSIAVFHGKNTSP